MQNLKQLYVFTNSRKIRLFNSKFEDELIPKSLSIAEFEKKAIYVVDRFEADANYLLVLMQRATSSVKEASERLKIPTEFFAFLKNNNYLFSFFKELAIQKKSIADIKFSDIYADYEEHLSILEEVLKNYKILLANEGLYDDITLPEIYLINDSFIKNFDEITVEIDGFLSEFEWDILLKISDLSHLKLIFSVSKFNKKMVEKICQLFKIDEPKLSLKTRYELDSKERSLTKIAELAKLNLVQKKAFSLRSLQAGYVMAKVAEFMREGISADKIAVILPDESFSEILKLYDTKRMLNFAMGESFKHTKFFQILDLIVCTISEKKNVNFQPKTASFYDEISFKFGEFGINQELFLLFKNAFQTQCEFSYFEKLINDILALQKDIRAEKIVHEAMFDMKNLARYFTFSLRQICEIFLMRLQEQSIDDIGGGEVSVIGVLESRGVSFDGVIIVDFNDDLIPKRSVNEMFLSSKVREKAGLISYTDRENLQRFYYESLISDAKKVAISYVQNEEKIPSRFLNEFSCVADEKYSEKSLSNLLLSGVTSLRNQADSFVIKHDFFSKPLSFSRLDTFLKSPKIYYYKYILGISEPKAVGKMADNQYGKNLHEALFDYYQKFEKFEVKKFEPILRNGEFSPLEVEILLLKFLEFEKNEQVRYDDGWRVKECEKKIDCVKFDGVFITGVIDRIDERKNELMIIDYKSGSFDVKSLQLPFYQALIGRDCASCFYDLKESMNLQAGKSSLETLKEVISELKKINNTYIDFSDSGQCRSSAFSILCKGEL